MNNNETNTHHWQVAIPTLRVSAEQIQDMLVAAALGQPPGFELPAGTETDPLLVNCRRCMRPYADAADEPCTPVPTP